MAVAIEDAATAAHQLGLALARAAQALTNLPDATNLPAATSRRGHGRDATTVSERRRARRQPRPPARRAVSVPGGVLDDSSEAAAYLLRLPGMILIVDGYNVTLNTWPSVDIAEQRRRLVSALSELAMRAPVAVRVVWDGAEDAPYPAPPGQPRGRWRRGSPPRAWTPTRSSSTASMRCRPTQAVTVATDDRRLRAEVARRGANVISTRQLLSVLGRGDRHTPRG